MKERLKKRLIFLLVFLLGLSVLLYPQISRFYYNYDSNKNLASYEKERKAIIPSEIERRLELAHSYNRSLENIIKEDPYEKKKQEEGKKEYAKMLEVNKQIGHVRIPKINVDISIYAGTNDDVLKHGIGHLEGTSLPVGGENTHSVLTGHSGLPNARLFSDLEKLEIGDVFYIHNLGGILAYKVNRVKTVLPDNFEDLLIENNKDYVTLLTCTPVMVNSHRLLVRGERIPYVKEDDDNNYDNSSFLEQYGLYILELLAIIVAIYILFIRKKKGDKEDEKNTYEK